MSVNRFYKFRGIDKEKINSVKVRENYAIKTLFDSVAIFSSRNNFNDLLEVSRQILRRF